MCIPGMPGGGGERGVRKVRLTFGRAEVFAGGGEASGPMHVDTCHSELVPPAGSYVSQLDPLICGLGGGDVTEHREPFYPDMSTGSVVKVHHLISQRHAALTSLCPCA